MNYSAMSHCKVIIHYKVNGFVNFIRKIIVNLRNLLSLNVTHYSFSNYFQDKFTYIGVLFFILYFV